MTFGPLRRFIYKHVCRVVFITKYPTAVLFPRLLACVPSGVEGPCNARVGQQLVDCQTIRILLSCYCTYESSEAAGRSSATGATGAGTTTPACCAATTSDRPSTRVGHPNFIKNSLAVTSRNRIGWIRNAPAAFFVKRARKQSARIVKIRGIVVDVSIAIQGLGIAEVSAKRVRCGPTSRKAVVLPELRMVQPGSFIAFGECKSLPHFTGGTILLRGRPQADA